MSYPIILTPKSIAEAQKLGFPDNILPRWNMAIRNDRMIEWRSFAFLLSAEARLAKVNDQHATSRDLLALHELAMQYVYSFNPLEVAA
jgi:hypothetical protein